MTQEEKLIIETAKKYPLAFKEMNTSIIDEFFSTNSTKTGFIYDYENNNWTDISTVGIVELKNWVTQYNQNKIMPESELALSLLDFQSKTAVVKIELEWAPNKMGCDYLFLVKENKKWLIQKILYQSIV